jgi:enoyl-CoA hydratase/carnithine racemase
MVVSMLTTRTPVFGRLRCGRSSAFCRLRRGLSPLAFCYLNACSLQPAEASRMSMPATASLPDDPALLRIEGSIATITLNRPAAFNSIDLSIAKKLEQLGAQVEASPEIRVLVIEGEGRAFSAGGDLQTIGAAAAADTIAPVVGELLKHYHAFIETLRRMPKIVLSSVHGSAAGAGMGLAFVADLCIAADNARFTPAYAKIGVSPDGGSTVGMVGTVGVRRALQIFLAEDSFSAQQAYEWGLVARVVPSEELKAATRQFAGRLAQNPSAAIAGTKSLVYQAAVTSTKQQLAAEEAGIIAAMQSEEFRVAVKKFTSKNK